MNYVVRIRDDIIIKKSDMNRFIKNMIISVPDLVNVSSSTHAFIGALCVLLNTTYVETHDQFILIERGCFNYNNKTECICKCISKYAVGNCVTIKDYELNQIFRLRYNKETNKFSSETLVMYWSKGIFETDK